MVPLTIIVGLFIFGIFNSKLRQLAFISTSLLLFSKRFRHLIFTVSKLFILGLCNKKARKSAFHNSKRILKVIRTI